MHGSFLSKRELTIAAAGAALALCAPCAGAYVNGAVTGRSRTGCNTATGCHGPSGTGATAVIAGPMRLSPSQRATYTLTINSTRADFAAGGCDVSVTGGSLATAAGQAGTRVFAGEVTHTAALPRAAGGPVTVRFDVVAPASGAFTIYAAGNAVNNNRLVTGDAWALASLAVTVTGSSPDAGPPPDAPAPADASAPTDDIPELPPGTPVPTDPSRSEAYGRCSASPRGHGAQGAWALAMLGGVAALAKRRRR